MANIKIMKHSWILGLILLMLFSCEKKKQHDESYLYSEGILKINSFKDSGFCVLNFKQGSFNIYKFNDTLHLYYNKFSIGQILNQTKELSIDTAKLNKEKSFERQGTWQYDEIYDLNIFQINNKYIKEIKKLESYGNIGTPYNFNWSYLKEKNIKGFISFSNPFFVFENQGLIAVNIFTEENFSMNIYRIEKETKAKPSKLLTFSFNLIGFAVERKNDEISNIIPTIISVK